MLTTHGLVQNTASFLFPSLLLLIAWYSSAAALRSFTEFLYRFRQKRKVGRNIKDLSRPLQKSEASTVSHTMHHYLGGLQNAIEESLLIGKKATGSRIAFAFLEALLFSTLAAASFYSAGPLLARLNHQVWWLHIAMPFFFLCFILRARRILLMLPLTFLALLSWEVVSFITSFEKTLEATTLMGTIEVKSSVQDRTKPDKPPEVTLEVTFRGRDKKLIRLPVGWKLYFEGRVYRVSTEVLLFGGRNLATIDRIFSDVIASKNGVVLVEKETVPPLYSWKEQGTPSYLIPQKKLFRWIWREFYRLRKRQYIGKSNPIQTKQLQATICPGPIRPGRRFEIRLRNVGGLECHPIKSKPAPRRRTMLLKKRATPKRPGPNPDVRPRAPVPPRLVAPDARPPTKRAGSPTVNPVIPAKPAPTVTPKTPTP